MRVNTVRCGGGVLLAAMDLKEIRRARLAQLAKLKKVEGDPSGLAALIGKKPNQVYNLLQGHASFGEKVARSIEEAAQLPALWLDLEQTAGELIPGWPFEPALLDRLVALSERDRLIVQGRLEAAIESREYSPASQKDEAGNSLLDDRKVSPTKRTAPETNTLLDARMGGRRSASSTDVRIQKPRRNKGSK